MQRFHTIKIENRRTFQISHSYLISTHNTLGLESECVCVCVHARARANMRNKDRSNAIIETNRHHLPPFFRTLILNDITK